MRFVLADTSWHAVSLLVLFCAAPASAQVPAPLLESGRPVKGTLAPGDVHAYRVPLDAGAVARLVVEQRGVDVVVASFAPAGSALTEVDSPNGRDGPEPMTIIAGPAGEYRIEIRRLEGAEAPVGEYEARVEALLTAVEFAAEQAMLRARRDSATAWLGRNAIRLTTVEAGHGFADMQPLRQVVGNARVVALGEATHGTREFFQLKHRMLEFLVSEMGFTAFAIEATMPEGFDVDEYVQTGRGDPAKALSGLYFWTWNTEEVLALIKWMRAWNADPRHLRKLHFYGFDMQSPPRAARVVRDYLRRVDRGAPAEDRQWLDMLIDPFRAEAATARPEADRAALAQQAAALVALFDERRAAWSAGAGVEAWAVARQHARILQQNLASGVRPDSLMIVRDRSMADNVRWIVDREGPRGRVVLWAHNGHVANDCSTLPMEWMGCHLRRAFGDSMVVMGFAFNRGGFQAVEMPFSAGLGLRAFTVAPLDESSLDATLARAGLSIAAVDLRTRPGQGPVADWFAGPLQTRSIGAAFSDAVATALATSDTVARRYDVLLFVENTTPARSMPSGRVSPRTPLPDASNLGFEDVDAEGLPVGWFFNLQYYRAFDFQAGVSTVAPAEGQRSAEVSRRPGRHYGESDGVLTQRIDATAYRGRRVRFRALARASLQGEGSAAHLFLRVGRSDQFLFVPDASPPSSAEVRGRTWEPIVLEVSVPDDAVSIDFGLALVGDGSAGIDAVRLEVVP